MEEFFARLRAHKLVQWSLGYVAVSFAVIPVLDIIAQSFGWPRTVVRCTIIALVTGFCVMLVLAWYHGERGVQRVTRTEHALLATLVVLGALAMWQLGPPPVKPAIAKVPAATPAAHAPEEIAPAAVNPKSVAVLPFENLSADKGNAYFADGMQDLILTKLADIGDLKVISRTSTQKYKSHPDNLKTVGEQLGVATVLEGSVQKAGKEVLINVQLIDAKTDSHVWAESYTRTLDNIFGVEGEVAQKVADALKAKLTSTETRQVAALPTQNPQAYDAYLRGLYYENRAYSSLLAADFAAAIESYAKATQLDPRFALAWAASARNLSFQIHFNNAPADTSALAAEAKTAVDHALTLAPNMAEAHLAQGWYQYHVQHDLGAALASFKAGLSLQPHNAMALFAIAVINKHDGHMQAAIDSYQKAVALDPMNVLILDDLALTQVRVHHYAAAEKTFRRAIAIDPSATVPVVNLAQAYRLTGDLDQAEATFDAAPASMQENPRLVFGRAELMLYRRDNAAARKLYANLKPGVIPPYFVELVRGDVEWYAGNQPQAREHYLRAQSLIETSLGQTPKSAFLHDDLGWVYARLGRNREALEQGTLAINFSQASNDAMAVVEALGRMTAIQAQVGRTDDAIAGLDRLLTMPSGEDISVASLELDPTWDPIRHDPRFQALLKKYADVTPTP